MKIIVKLSDHDLMAEVKAPQKKRCRLDALVRFCLYIFIGVLIFLQSCAPSGVPPVSENFGKEEKVHRGPVLLVVAHQDDDLFIVSRLRQHIVAGDSVFVVWTASSEPFGKGYAETRLEESGKAMAFLGVPPENCYYLRYPDGQTFTRLAEIITRLKAIVQKVQPGVIYVPAYEMGHIDHDIAHYAAVRVGKDLGLDSLFYEFPIYSAYRTPWPLPFKMRSWPGEITTAVRPLTDTEYGVVLDYWEIYKSQHFPFGMYMSLVSGRKKSLGYEYLRKIPDYNYHLRPFRADAAYERFLDEVRFKDFIRAVRQAEGETPQTDLLNGAGKGQ